MSKLFTHFKERYNITCPHCNADLNCRPNGFHLQGFFEVGGGNCVECKRPMQIHYQPETDTMQAYKPEHKETVNDVDF